MPDRQHPTTGDEPPPQDRHGFTPSARTGPFIDLIGPLYTRTDERGIVLGLAVDERHTNTRGHVHGAIISALCDLVLGRNAATQTDPPTPLVTTSLSIDLIGTARVGDWLEASATVQHTGRRLAFAQAIVTARERTIAQASGVFTVVDPGRR